MLAKVIVERALERVSARGHCAVEAVLADLQRGERAVWLELKLGLAHYAAEFLGFFDEDVKAVYVSDFADSYRRNSQERAPRRMVHLIVLAETKTAALKSVVNALDRALAGVVSERIGGTATERSLEVKLVDSADLEELGRFAALLTPVSHCATCVWERESSGVEQADQANIRRLTSQNFRT